jgi:excisionase family DNA binding protein
MAATKTNKKPKQRHEILTLEEAAEFLRVQKDKLEHDVRNGKVPCRLVGGEWRFNKLVLYLWLNSEVKPAKSGRPPAGIGRDYDEDPEEIIAEMYRQRKQYLVGG